MREGAQATTEALGLGEEYFAGKILSADRNSPSEENLQACAPEPLDASMPDNQCRQRDPRFATQARPHPPTDEKVTAADCTYDQEQDYYRCPGGKGLKLKARRHPSENNLYRRSEAAEAECQGCPLREQCLQTPEARRNHLASLIEQATETLSQKLSAKIATPEARAIDGQRLALVEPVFGHLRAQKRLDRLTVRGKVKVNIQWMLYCMVHNIEKILH
jgi:Transposase DDE domain